MNSSCSQTTATSITLSSSFNLIHLTHAAHLHIGLTSSSSNCIALPSFEAINILSFHVVVLTHIKSSHSFTQHTFNQLALIFFTLSISSFLTIQYLLTKNKNLFFSCVISKIADISSPFCREIKLIIGCPLAVLVVSGTS